MLLLTTIETVVIKDFELVEKILLFVNMILWDIASEVVTATDSEPMPIMRI